MQPTATWVEIICSECATHCWGRWVFGSHIPVREFQQEAKDRKWRQRTDGEFTCPACDAKMLKELGVTA